jgi:hypothetical protein
VKTKAELSGSGEGIDDVEDMDYDDDYDPRKRKIGSSTSSSNRIM